MEQLAPILSEKIALVGTEKKIKREEGGKEKKNTYSFDNIEGSLKFFLFFFSFLWIYFIFIYLVIFFPSRNFRNRSKIRGNFLEWMYFSVSKIRQRRWNLDDETSVQARRTLNVLNNSGCLINRASDKKARNDEIMCSSAYSRLFSLLCHYFYSKPLYIYIYIFLYITFSPLAHFALYKIRLDLLSFHCFD